jgi:sigma-B regulation protein RsbU (phosphoserine phosphatase)
MAFLERFCSTGLKETLPLGTKTTFGRSGSNTISLSDSKVSRHHAEIRKKYEYFVLIDNGSANGTMVNAKALHQHVPQPLYEGDEIKIGTTCFVFRSEGEEPLAKKKKSTLTVTRPVDKDAVQSGLSVIFTSEIRAPSISATMYASRAMLGVSEEEKISQHGLQQAVSRLQAMVRVSQNLGALEKPDALLDKIMQSIFDMFPHADRAFIMLRDKHSDELKPTLGRTRENSGDKEEFQISRTIISAVTEKSSRSSHPMPRQTSALSSCNQSSIYRSVP